MNKKRKLFILFVSLILAISVAMGIVMAVLMTKTERRVNEFTFGDAQIDLTEENWDTLKPEDKILYPNRVIVKDPKVKNTGKTDLYIFIEVQIPCANIQTVHTETDKETLNPADWHELFSYKVNEGWELIENGLSDDKKTATKVYAYTAKIVAPEETTSTLFDSVQYMNVIEGQLKMGDTLNMPINAYAIQAEYLNEQGTTVKEKMLDAYSKYKVEVAKP